MHSLQLFILDLSTICVLYSFYWFIYDIVILYINSNLICINKCIYIVYIMYYLYMNTLKTIFTTINFLQLEFTLELWFWYVY